MAGSSRHEELRVQVPSDSLPIQSFELQRAFRDLTVRSGSRCSAFSECRCFAVTPEVVFRAAGLDGQAVRGGAQASFPSETMTETGVVAGSSVVRSFVPREDLLEYVPSCLPSSHGTDGPRRGLGGSLRGWCLNPDDRVALAHGPLGPGRINVHRDEFPLCTVFATAFHRARCPTWIEPCRTYAPARRDDFLRKSIHSARDTARVSCAPPTCTGSRKIASPQGHSDRDPIGRPRAGIRQDEVGLHVLLAKKVLV